MKPHKPSCSALIIIVTAVIVFYLGWIWGAESRAPMDRVTEPYQFSYLSGFFEHDKQPVGPDSGFRAKTLPRLGLLDQGYKSDDSTSRTDHTQWQRFAAYIRSLNAKSRDEQIKVLFVARHGEGVHNVKEHEVGRHEWERYWSRLEGDDSSTWMDAALTSRGLQQAREVGDFWQRGVEDDRLPMPQSWYTSPLKRCLQTVQATWGPLIEPRPFRAEVVEALREVSGVHTCDKRGTRSQIQNDFPDFVIESSLTEEDRIWKSDRRETQSEHAMLWQAFLEKLFNSDESIFVSITTHSGATRALYEAIGHPDVWTAAGSVVPIVVRGERRQT